MFFGWNLLSVNPLACVQRNNQEYKVSPENVNVNSNGPVFYPFSIKASKCSGTCNNINDPCANLCVPDVVKNINIKVFNLMSRSNETRHIECHEIWKCKCRLDPSVCNSKQRWNKDTADVNVKNWLTKDYVTKDLFGILVIVNVYVINHVMLGNV